MLSEYCSDIAENYGIKVGGVKKLIPNLGNKSKYIVYYQNLYLYLALGMKLTKVHKVLKFKQSDCIKTYNKKTKQKNKKTKKKNKKNKNIKKKTKKKIPCYQFGKFFFKLMIINSVYGKTMENLRKRIHVRLVNNAKDNEKYVSKPNFVSQKFFNKNLLAIHEIKQVLTRNKPI